jgi:hypothetical protein
LKTGVNPDALRKGVLFLKMLYGPKKLWSVTGTTSDAEIESGGAGKIDEKSTPATAMPSSSAATASLFVLSADAGFEST